jgi:hypothetical protein
MKKEAIGMRKNILRKKTKIITTRVIVISMVIGTGVRTRRRRRIMITRRVDTRMMISWCSITREGKAGLIAALG